MSEVVPLTRYSNHIPNDADVLRADIARLDRRLSEIEHRLFPPSPEPVRDPGPGRPTIDAIKRAVCAKYNISPTDLLANRRAKRAVWARQVAMYLARNLTVNSFPTIGRLLGNLDHSTVIHGWKRVGIARASEPVIDEMLTRLEALLLQDANAKAV